MAQFEFYAGENFNIFSVPNASGLGFYGNAGFGASVLVGEWQGRTFITNPAGTLAGPECDNIKFINNQSGIIGQAGAGINLLNIPNYQGTLNIRFTHTSSVNVQNVRLRIYDRNNINNVASGVTTRVAELIHDDNSQLIIGSGDNIWIGVTANPQTGTFTVGGSGTIVTLANNPGNSGSMAGNGTDSTHASLRHDWFVAISSSPDNIGSKLYALYTELEFL